jgi:hypothetical protein
MPVLEDNGFEFVFPAFDQKNYKFRIASTGMAGELSFPTAL